MAAATETLTRRQVRDRPAAWDLLLPSDPNVLWQVWMRRKGLGYWLLRYATKLANVLCKIERAFGRDVPESLPNPNGLEDGGTFETEDEARDACRDVWRRTEGCYAVTYCPLLVGRAYPVEHVECKGDRRFDPFKAFDYSATEDVRRQARYVLVEAEDLRAARDAVKEAAAALRGER